MKKKRLIWTDYKSINGSRSAWWAGGFTVYVVRHDDNFNLTDTWRVKWYDAPEIKSLTRARFKTRSAAQRAAEEVFVPMLDIAPRMVQVGTKTTAQQERL